MDEIRLKLYEDLETEKLEVDRLSRASNEHEFRLILQDIVTDFKIFVKKYTQTLDEHSM